MEEKFFFLNISNLIKDNQEYANIPEVIKFHKDFINVGGVYHPNNETQMDFNIPRKFLRGE